MNEPESKPVEQKPETTTPPTLGVGVEDKVKVTGKVG